LRPSFDLKVFYNIELFSDEAGGSTEGVVEILKLAIEALLTFQRPLCNPVPPFALTSGEIIGYVTTVQL